MPRSQIEKHQTNRDIIVYQLLSIEALLKSAANYPTIGTNLAIVRRQHDWCWSTYNHFAYLDLLGPFVDSIGEHLVRVNELINDFDFTGHGDEDAYTHAYIVAENVDSNTYNAAMAEHRKIMSGFYDGGTE